MERTVTKNLDFSKKESATEAKSVRFEGDSWDASELQAQSKTKIEDDIGQGEAAIIRQFEFGANPEAFKAHKPTDQELFNHHLKQIEMMLWSDGLKLMTEVEPRIRFSKNKSKYRIFIGARPRKGHILREKPQTLTEIVHG